MKSLMKGADVLSAPLNLSLIHSTYATSPTVPFSSDKPFVESNLKWMASCESKDSGHQLRRSSPTYSLRIRRQRRITNGLRKWTKAYLNQELDDGYTAYESVVKAERRYGPGECSRMPLITAIRCAMEARFKNSNLTACLWDILQAIKLSMRAATTWQQTCSESTSLRTPWWFCRK